MTSSNTGYVGKIPCSKCVRNSAMVYKNEGNTRVQCGDVTCKYAETYYSDDKVFFEDGDVTSLGVAADSKYKFEDLNTKIVVEKVTDSRFHLPALAIKSEHRGIKPETMKVFGYGRLPNFATPFGLLTVHVANYTNELGNTVYRKVRYGDGERKGFTSLVDYENNTKDYFFGQFRQGDANKAKIVVITEGELCAMSVYQAYKNYGSWAPTIVSVPKGAGGDKVFVDQLDWLDQFSEIKICFDNDDVGKAAAASVARMLPSSKTQIVKLTDYKDPNDYLTAEDNEAQKNLRYAILNATSVVDVTLMTKEDIMSSFDEKGDEYLSTGMPFLDRFLSGGLPLYNPTTIPGGTGVGKSTVAYNIMANVVKAGKNVLLLNTEMSNISTMTQMAAFYDGKGYPMVRKKLLQTEGGKEKWHKYRDKHVRPTADKILASGNFHMLHKKSFMDWESSREKLASLVKMLDIDLLVIDNMTGMVRHVKDKTSMLGQIASDVNDIGLEQKCTPIFVVHVTNNGGGKQTKDGSLTLTYENGAEVSLHNISDASTIPKYSGMVFSYERDCRKSDGSALIRLLKEREPGPTGLTLDLIFDYDTWSYSEAPLTSGRSQQPKIKREEVEEVDYFILEDG